MTRSVLHLRIAALVAAVCAGGRTWPFGRGTGPGQSRIDRWRRHRRRGDRTERTGSRRLGHRRNDRPAHAPDQERGHRRSGSLRPARLAEGELRRVGPRLRPRGLAEGQGDARTAAGADAPWPHRTPRPRQSTTRRSTGSRCCRCRPKATSPAPVRPATASRRTCEVRASGFASIVNTDGCTGCHQMGNKATREIPEALGHVRKLEGGMGSPRSVRTGRRRHELARSRRWAVRARSRCGRTGPIELPAASCRRRRRRGRRAENATSS